MRTGDGAAACAYLTDAEQEALVANAKDVTPALDGDSCESVVESFHEAHAKTLHAGRESPAQIMQPPLGHGAKQPGSKYKTAMERREGRG